MGWLKYIGEEARRIYGEEWEPGEVKQLADFKIRQFVARAPDVLKPVESGESPKKASRAKPRKKVSQTDEVTMEGEE